MVRIAGLKANDGARFKTECLAVNFVGVGRYYIGAGWTGCGDSQGSGGRGGVGYGGRLRCYEFLLGTLGTQKTREKVF
jgi:hypothetical protein